MEIIGDRWHYVRGKNVFHCKFHRCSIDIKSTRCFTFNRMLASENSFKFVSFRFFCYIRSSRFSFQKLKCYVSLCSRDEFLQERYATFGMFVPGIDDKSANPFMPQHPAIRAKAGVQVPLLIGFNSNEGSMFLNGKFIFLMCNFFHS